MKIQIELKIYIKKHFPTEKFQIVAYLLKFIGIGNGLFSHQQKSRYFITIRTRELEEAVLVDTNTAQPLAENI